MDSRSSLKILSLSCVYPNPTEPGLGLFVRSRLQQAARGADITVLAPVGIFDYSRNKGTLFGSRGVPKRRADGPIETLHPRWIYPPFGGAINAVCLFAAMLPLCSALRRRFPFDLIDAHFGYPDGIAAAMLSSTLGVPFLVTLRGNETMHGRYPIRGRLMCWALRRAARVITVSGSLRKFAIEQGVPHENVVTIPNGIDTARCFPRDRSESRRRWDIPETARVVLSAGYLIERKGHHRTVRALRDRDALLLIAGGPGREGEYEQAIRREVADLGMEDRVRFLGHVPADRLPELMSAADVFCLASGREGWPNVVHEAMACGTPVVATAVGGVPEMIPSEDYGYVAPADDPGALEAAVARALSKNWDRDRIAAWAQARSWEQVGREVLDVMRSVVAERKPR